MFGRLVRWGGALGVSALVFLVFAPEAWAERACANPVGRTCSEETCFSLQSVVNNTCKNQQIFRCSKLSQCPALYEMRRRWMTCAQARDRINSICWGGGDPNHAKKAAEAWQNVGNCNMKISSLCGDSPWDDVLNITPNRSDVVSEPLVEMIERWAAAGDLIKLLEEEVAPMTDETEPES